MTNIDFGLEVQARANMLWDGSYNVNPSSFKQTQLDPIYGQATYEKQPPQVIDSVEFPNNTDSPGSMSFTNQRTFTATLTQVITKSVTTTTGAAMNAVPVPDVGNVNFTASNAVLMSTADTTTRTVAQEFAETFTQQVAPRTKVIVDSIVTPQKATIPYTSPVRIKGSIRLPSNLPLWMPFSDYFAPTIGLGKLFEKYPTPNVKVIDDDVVEVSQEGKFVGVIGRSFNFSPRSESLK